MKVKRSYFLRPLHVEFNRNYFLTFTGKIFQITRQSKKAMQLFFYSVFFVVYQTNKRGEII